MKRKKLTIIIPFLNEKYEVEKTLESIYKYSTADINIILINDASDDNFDYKVIAKKYKAKYIENKERMGVASSRDLGVELCETPYFLFLDAHMRFYNDNWNCRIVEELEADKRALICCQTKVLHIKNGLEIEPKNRGITYGACIEFYNWMELVDPYWVYGVPPDIMASQTIPIVCVLGAGYACCKEYWIYLKGLTGLKYYGNDESYISMKVWMEGGSCKLLQDVVIGHIYRTEKIPYSTSYKYRLYNKLFIAELLLPSNLKAEILSKVRYYYPYIFPKSMLLLHKNRNEIIELKKYYLKIFSFQFSFFEDLNNKYHPKVPSKSLLVNKIENILYDIFSIIETSITEDIGLLNGSMGFVIYYFHYGRFINNNSYIQKAESTLEHLVSNIKPDVNYSLYSGFTGIGWGIEYLHQQGFIEGDTNEILEDFDKRIMEINPERIVNVNREYGLGGIVLYLISRLYSVEKWKRDSPFDEEYLRAIYNRIKSIVDENDSECDSLDVFWKFMNYYDDKKEFDKPEIYDVWCLLNPENLPLQDMYTGLKGVAGVGLGLILEY